jgi:glycosyltransferase involved in cell wall biosynthesis
MKLSIITATYNRPQQLLSTALPSILNQSDRNFEWIVINDGGNIQTRDMITDISTDLPIIYLEMEHPSSGFGLCHARNFGLDVATAELITYLDDDNSFYPEFVATVRELFLFSPETRYLMNRQYRHRNVVNNGKIIRTSKPFVSPTAKCDIQQLIRHKEIFDSNGFAHYRRDAPRWNPVFKVFADYEYLLQCVEKWGKDAFKFNDLVLINYIQSNEGTIGSSTYKEWVEELTLICRRSHHYPTLQPTDVECLNKLIADYQGRANMLAPAFV